MPKPEGSMLLIPIPFQQGKPYRLKIGDRINYFLRFNAVQICANGGDEVEFSGAQGQYVPRYILPSTENVATIRVRLEELLESQGVDAVLVQVENSHPSINTYEVVAKAL